MSVRVVSRANRSPLLGVLSLTFSLTSCIGSVDDPRAFAPCVDCATEVGGGDGAGRPPAAGDPNTPHGVGWGTRFPKLSNQQWENTVAALLYLDAPPGLAQSFTQEPLDKGYPALAAATLTVGNDAFGRYQAAAEQVAASIVTDDQKLAKIAPSGSFDDVASRGAAFVARFGKRAYRRPLSTDERRAYEGLFAKGPELVGGDAFKAGARLVIEAMLQSPHFLYRVESSTVASADRKVRLSGYEVATRLSYALWNSMPSDAQLAAAEAGELDSKDGVGRWAERLLDDPRAREVLLAFHEQTFQTATYGTQDKLPELGFRAEALGPTLREEARRTFELVVITQNRGIEALLTEPIAFVNEDTAPFYGLSGVTGKALQQRALDPAQRAGLLTQLGFLSKNATRSGSDPVHRGLVVVRQLLCDEPDPPPMMFQLPSAVAGLTTREVYERATACGGSCHAELINPPGFAFEAFDAVGRVRVSEAGKAIDTRGTLMIRTGFTPDETRAGPKTPLSFDGPVALLTKLAVEPRVHDCYARHFMQATLARDLDPVERGAVASLGAVSRGEGSARALLRALVALDAFRYRVSDAL